MLPSIALAGKRPENVQWLKYRCFNRLSMCLSVSVFCAICPGARSSLAGFGTGFGSAEDLRAGAGGSPRIRPIGRVARGPSGGSSDHTLWSFFVSQAVFASTRLRIGENPARNSSRAWEAGARLWTRSDQAMGTRCSTTAAAAVGSRRGREARCYRAGLAQRFPPYHDGPSARICAIEALHSPHRERSNTSPLVAGAMCIARAASPNARLTSAVEHVHTPARHLLHQDLLHPFCGVSAALSAL